jgi:hypothetical protein
MGIVGNHGVMKHKNSSGIETSMFIQYTKLTKQIVSIILGIMILGVMHRSEAQSQPQKITPKSVSKNNESMSKNNEKLSVKIQDLLSLKVFNHWRKEIKNTRWKRPTAWQMNHVHQNLIIVWPSSLNAHIHWPVYILENHQTRLIPKNKEAQEAHGAATSTKKKWHLSTQINLPLVVLCKTQGCTQWQVKRQLQTLCNQPVIALQYKASDHRKSTRDYLHLITWNQTRWISIFHQAIKEHYFADGHREASMSDSILRESQHYDGYTSSKHELKCNDLIVTTKNSARSFNLVDAPESEFAEAEEEEVIWKYDAEKQIFIVYEEEEIEIKIRER